MAKYANSKIIVTKTTLLYDVWVSKGLMKIRRDSLDADDPDQVYNYLTSFGIKPEQYGIKPPYIKEFEHLSRGALISEILELRKQIMGYEICQ